ncbi:MAG: 30S ribosomal protein S13 [Verrucomicrobiae bacterium]|nr:30S ribosomal protein S13 [Verrucomicrobiae bacterium]
MRLLGVDVPDNKRIDVALRYLYGIGPSRAVQILQETKIDPGVRAKNLTDDQLTKITGCIARNKYVIEGDLRREIALNLKRLMAINCYRGTRHRKGLPVRGQRTQTNARTRKGPRKTVGVQRAKETKAPAKV